MLQPDTVLAIIDGVINIQIYRLLSEINFYNTNITRMVYDFRPYK
jgi:hypothetical protein